MTSIFQIVSSEQWDEAKLTGLVPRTLIDEDNSFVTVYKFNDLESVTNHYFKATDYPVALEFSPDSYAEQIIWKTSDEKTQWQVGQLSIDLLSADLVLNIYSFDYQENNKLEPFKIQGESW